MKKLLIVLMCLGMVGCVTVSSINRNFNKIDYSDGVNSKEAIFIAQKHCLDNSDCRKYFIISSPKIDWLRADGTIFTESYWHINFPPKRFSLIDHNYTISIDKSGEVLTARWNK